MKFKLELITESEYGDDMEVIFKFSTPLLSEVIQNFNQFLHACGFNYEGELEIVDDNKNCPKHMITPDYE